MKLMLCGRSFIHTRNKRGVERLSHGDTIRYWDGVTAAAILKAYD
jgi:hypothetical protein